MRSLHFSIKIHTLVLVVDYLKHRHYGLMPISLNGQIPHQLSTCRHIRLFQLPHVKVKRKI